MASPAVPAATLVVLRPGRGGPEVLMVRRHERSADLPGVSVFPGGLVDSTDADPELAHGDTGYDPATAQAALGETLDAELTRSLYVAACRELFEEAGLLLARHDDGSTLRADALARAQALRLELQAGSAALADVLRAERARLDLRALLPFARWITPEHQPRRWDARFFLAAAPIEQEAACDGTETCEAVWLRPEDALARYRAGADQLAPPTFRILEELALHPSVDAAFDAARAAGPPTPILPVPLAGAPRLTMVYPGDREYPGSTARGLNRIVLDGGRWWSERSG